MKPSEPRDNPSIPLESAAVFGRHDAPMAAWLREKDWTGTTLGPPRDWPPALSAAVSLMLDSATPVWLAWGPELSMLYNGPYASMLGNKHPNALGAPLREVWAEVWTDVGALVAATLAGQPIYREDLPLLVRRHAHDEQAWFTFSYTPLRDEGGTPRGLICHVWETTSKVLAQRRLVQSESRLSALTRANTNVVYRVSPDWRWILELNGQGFVADVAAPQPDWMTLYVHPEDRAAVSSAIDKAVQSRGRFELEHRVIRTDGTPGWTLSRAIPVINEQGEITEWFGTATDITEGHASRQALERANEVLERRVEDSQAQQRPLAAIVESTHATVHVVDPQGRWIAMNAAARASWTAMCGTPPRLGDRLLDALGNLQGTAWEAAWQAALTGKEHTVQLEWRDPERGPRVQELSFNALRDSAHQIYAIYQFAVDITERLDEQRRLKEARAALVQAQRRETEERRRLAVQATNDAVWDWRMADGQVAWNQALTELFGHPQQLTDAEWWLSHIHPEDRPRIESGIHAVIDGAGSTWADEYRFRKADGSYANVLDRGTVLRGDQGQALRMIGAMQDLSEREQAQAALRESERQFQALFEMIDEGFCVIEFLDGPHGELSDYVHVAANPAYLANAGIPDVVGQRVREMVPDEADGWVEIYRRVLLTGEPVRFERELVRTGRYLELAAFRVDPPQRRQVAVLFQDVTPRRRAEIALLELNETLERRVQEEVAERSRTEEALRQAQKMEAVGQLTGGIAHDFNNMLAVVIGSLDLLDRRFVQDDARARRYVHAARDGARRAATLTQRLLAFSRQQPLRPESVDANKLVAGMSDLLRHSLGGDVRLETVLAGGLWRTHADPNQLENVILNLAVNGRDAMSEGGRLTIETANGHLDERYAADHIGLSAGQYVMIAVTDTGSGMPADVVAKAFDPFFTTKEVGRGTGLGLSQVYGFVKQSGGHVKIYSEPGEGTTVKVYLPRLAGPSQELASHQPSSSMPMGDSHELILVVEDEPAVRQFSVEALTELGYRVLEADGAAAALPLIDAHPDIDLLFTDVVMPDVNGSKLAEEARRRRPDLPVLFTTGYTRNAVVHNGVLDAGVLLIGKPFTVEELAVRVREALDAAQRAKSSSRERS